MANKSINTDLIEKLSVVLQLTVSAMNQYTTGNYRASISSLNKASDGMDKAITFLHTYGVLEAMGDEQRRLDRIDATR